MEVVCLLFQQSIICTLNKCLSSSPIYPVLALSSEQDILPALLLISKFSFQVKPVLFHCQGSIVDSNSMYDFIRIFMFEDECYYIIVK